jgi:hypothetical protein
MRGRSRTLLDLIQERLYLHRIGLHAQARSHFLWFYGTNIGGGSNPFADNLSDVSQVAISHLRT